MALTNPVWVSRIHLSDLLAQGWKSLLKKIFLFSLGTQTFWQFFRINIFFSIFLIVLKLLGSCFQHIVTKFVSLLGIGSPGGWGALCSGSISSKISSPTCQCTLWSSLMWGFLVGFCFFTRGILPFQWSPLTWFPTLRNRFVEVQKLAQMYHFGVG